LSDGVVQVQEGELFAEPRPTGQVLPLSAVRLLTPCTPSKLIGLWNNFHQRAELEGLHPPEHPLYFVKTPNSYAAHGDPIPRPAGYLGPVVFEGELGIVVGRTCKAIAPEAAGECIFGYTCVNDVTARDLLKRDPAFVHWTRAKGFDGFGVFGPAIATGLDPAGLRVRTVLAGTLRQDYPVADMIFSPAEILSRISHDMTLVPGDLIACGTSVGVCAMEEGDLVEVSVEGIGTLANRFGGT
jgi:2-keto-4-pentenoate hydratase/2-oxohepta-3-ene-1,7-dioic acid hydratase in catechol pathway